MIAARDWTDTPFGPRGDWPAALGVILDLCLDSSFPSAVYWGPECSALYNDANAVLIGDRHPAALGAPACEIWPEVWERLDTLFKQVMATGEGIAASETPLLVMRGGVLETIWVNYSFTPVRDRSGEVIGIFTQAVDATANVKAKEALAVSEERLRIALSASNSVGTWDWDVQADRATADERFAKMLDLPEETVAEGASILGFMERVHPDDRELLTDAFQRTLRTGEDFQAEYRIQPLSGGERWLVAQGRCSFVDGKPSHFSGVSFDLTQRKRAEQGLRRAKEERDFVLSITEQQRTESDADGVMQITAEALAKRIGVSRAGYFRVSDDGKTLDYGACWTDGIVLPLAGQVPTSALGPHVAKLAGRGMTLAFGDAEKDPQVGEASFAAIDTRAAIGVPLVRGGRWVGSFYVTEPQPRTWAAEEVALVEEVAQLSWDAVARVEALVSLREANAALAGQVAATREERDRIWEESRDLLGIATTDGVFINANPAWTRLLGWTPAEIIGKSTEWLEHPDDRERTRGEVGRLAAEGDSFGFENRFRTADGDYRTLSWTAARIEDRIYCTGRDVTAERAQQAALREAEELSRLAMATVNGVGTWTYEIASDRLITDVGFAHLYGLDREAAAAGIPMADALRNIHPDDLAAAARKLEANRTVAGVGQGEYRIRRGDGQWRWVLSRSHTIADAEGRPASALGVVLDVTEQRAMEDQLRQAQKMEAVGQLTGGLAHDFNNLLTAISGAMEMLQVRLGQERYDALPAYVNSAQSATRRAAALTHRLLAFSRRQTLDPRPTDVNRLIGEIEELVRRTVGPGVRVEVETDPALAPALIDANQLENALLNLCINARDAMGGEGVIHISTRNVTLEDGAAEELDVAPGDYLRLDIADAGAGMSADVISRAFDPFFTTKPMGEGTGLGLSMIYGFARQSGGQIAIDSEVGLGTTMSLYLPRHVGETDVAASEPGQLATRGGHGQTVLVVEDEASVRMLVSDALSELDYDVIEAEDGVGAIKILTSDATIDLLVTDVGLPGGINGRQVADAARLARPGLGVLFITGYAENAVIGNAPLEAGMELLTKPFTIEALSARVADMVAR
ncbi:hypothetical protein BH09PSE4_BH09PSE4_22030 [soil metagenome]